MRWYSLLVPLLLCCALACCGPLSAPPTVVTPFLPTATPAPTVPLPLPPSPSPSPTVQPTPTALPPAPALLADNIQLFPAPPCPGDWLSADVRPLLPPGEATYTVTLALPSGEVAQARVAPHGLDDAPRARFYWSVAVPPETAAITFTLEVPSGVSDPFLTDNVVVVSLAACDPPPPPEPDAVWTLAETEGFRLHYLTGSAAERDLAQLQTQAQTAYRHVTAQIGAREAPLDIYFLARVIGQGGYAAGDWVAISYLDRNYAPGNLELVLRHELVHWVDDALGCHRAPQIVREGLAVMGAGGHYWPVPPEQQAAALLHAGQWIPLAELAVDFYTHQHEIGYAEAGALLAYIQTVYGWADVELFCRATAAAPGGPVAQLASGARALGYADLDAFDAAWLGWLAGIEIPAAAWEQFSADLRLMDTLRAYQLQYDPPAHFLTGILFSPRTGAERDIVADFVRRPRTVDAAALELLLVLAQEAAARRDAAAMQALLDVIETTLADGFPVRGLAADARALTAAALARGYDPYRLEPTVTGYDLYAVDLAAWPRQQLFVATRADEEWHIQLEDAR